MLEVVEVVLRVLLLLLQQVQLLEGQAVSEVLVLQLQFEEVQQLMLAAVEELPIILIQLIQVALVV